MNKQIQIPEYSKYQPVLILAVLLVVFSVTFFLNRLYPVFADDWVYSFVFETSFFDHSDKRIEGITDILVSQYNHYMLWGGRSVAHTIAQFLLSINPFLCDLLNSLVYLGFVYLIYLFAVKGRGLNIGALILVAVLIWVFVPAFTPDVLWITGSANYLWCTSILLLFAYPYFSFFIIGKESRDSIPRIVLFFVAGIVAGWTNENTVPPMILSLAIVCIYFYRNKKLSKWMVSGFIGICIGYIIMVAAPGNYARMDMEIISLEQNIEPSLFSTLLHRLGKMLSGYYLKYMLPLVVAYVGLYILYIKCSAKTEGLRKNKIYTSLLFFMAGHIAFFIMLATPTFPLRAMFGIVVYMIIAISIIYSEIDLQTPLLKRLNLLFIIGLIALYGLEFYRKYPSIKLISETFKAREAILEEQKAKGINDIIFDTQIGVHEKYGFEDLSDYPDQWMNKEYAKYHGVRSVKIKKKD
ncbi:MAG: DUF6056 family protein [Prevotella sp.]|jgi:hypothetical protein|nr:DUF6056 family protein [Prevotella sp.]